MTSGPPMDYLVVAAAVATIDSPAIAKEATPDLGDMMTAIRLMLADDHRMLREGLSRSMREQGFDIVGEAGDGAEAVALALTVRPDVILMDVTMPEIDGVEACR